MKKIININLSGRVIPIEDSAYESLQRYIDSLRRYFAAEEGRDEIINDIESRVAELMNDKIKKGAAAVTESDINEIINTMGRVEDFEQADQQESTTAGTTVNEPFTEAAPVGKRPRGRLYRDSSDKILGGVCAGIANYLNIDPAIIRILLVLLIFGAGSGILIYILLWIVLPAKPLFKGPSNIKRLFRNPDDRIIGGVAGGIAAYFNKEAWIVRLIFAAPLILNILLGIFNGIFFVFDHDVFPNFFIGSFTGTFSITYIILWIILPEARSTYEKMEMRGETVDVNRIKQNVQEGMSDFKDRAQSWGQEVKTSAQNLGSQAREFADTRGRAFASEAAQAARPIASSIGNVIGLLFKIFLFCILGFFAFIFFIVVIAFVFGGIGEIAKDFLLEGFWQRFLAWTSILLFFGVPMLALITWLVRRLMKVRSHNRYLGWTFGGLWVLGVISIGLFVGSMFQSFRYYSQSPQQINITQPLNKMMVSVNEPVINYTGTYHWLNVDGDGDNGWDLTNDSLKISNVKMRIEKSEDSFYHVTLWRYSAGKNRTEAERRAQQIVYNVSSSDSILNLGSGFGISKEQKFRGQKVIVTIQVPVGKIIRFDETINDRLNPVNIRVRERIGNHRYRREWDMDWDNDSYYDWKPNVDYVMTAGGNLVDLNKPVGEEDVITDERENIDVYEYRRDSIEQKREIEDQIDEQRRRIEEEKRRLEELQRRKINRGTTKVTTPRKGGRFTNNPAQISSPIFSLLVI